MHTLESSLITGKWDPKLSELESCPPAAELAKDAIDGEFRKVLTSPLAKIFFRASELQDKSYEESFSWSLPSVTDEADKERIQVILAVACLHAFIQANWTGPDLNIKPSEVIVDVKNPTLMADEVLHVKAIAELAYGGEPAYHLAQHVAFLRLSQLIFALPYEHCISVPWWRLRTSIIHQQLLDEAVPLPPDALDSLEFLLQTVLGDRDLAGRLQLEQGRLEHIYSHDKFASEKFLLAARATGLQYELTGALGRRTKFQQKDLSQLVLLAESRKRDGFSAEDVPSLADQSRTPVNRPITTHSNLPVSLELNDDTLLEQTEFTSSPLSTTGQLNHLDPVSQPPLYPLDQCILLSLCLNVRNTSPSHGLTSEQMSPYVARVISHPENWSVHTMALLLRSRLESTRTRTVERSVFQLQAIIDQMPTADSSLPERLLYFHSIPLPSKWEMEHELASRFLTLGVVKSALEIFERLEMWEQVVKCWQSMERADRAIAIVRDLLEGRKEEAENVILRGKKLPSSRYGKLDCMRQAKLWCLLGDLEPDNAVKHYERAWTLSNETSGRAMRSLGGYYFTRGEYEKAVPCLQRAVNINPLMSRSWFILGCAHVRLENWEGARDSFSRCVSIDDEDGESWNNLASMYLRLDSSKNAGLDLDDVSETNLSYPVRTQFFLVARKAISLARLLRFQTKCWHSVL